MCLVQPCIFLLCLHFDAQFFVFWLSVTNVPHHPLLSELRQKRAVNVKKVNMRFSFDVKEYHSSTVRIVVAERGAHGGCGNFLFKTQPEWSSTGAGGVTSLGTQLQKVKSYTGFDKVAYHTSYSQSKTANIPGGFYPVCLCDQSNIGSNGCDSAACTASGCAQTEARKFPVEIATLFVHDLVFSVFLGEGVENISVDNTEVRLSFNYTEPRATFAKALVLPQQFALWYW